MDEKIKQLLQDLGTAINESISGSDDVNQHIQRIRDEGYDLYVVLDAWENEPFRKKFSTVPSVSLDWPPVLEAGTSHRTRLWRLSDRERFLRGEPLNITRLP